VTLGLECLNRYVLTFYRYVQCHKISCQMVVNSSCVKPLLRLPTVQIQLVFLLLLLMKLIAVDTIMLSICYLLRVSACGLYQSHGYVDKVWPLRLSRSSW